VRDRVRRGRARDDARLLARLHRHLQRVRHDRVLLRPPERALQLLPEREPVERELELRDLALAAEDGARHPVLAHLGARAERDRVHRAHRPRAHDAVVALVHLARLDVRAQVAEAKFTFLEQQLSAARGCTSRAAPSPITPMPAL